MDHLLEQVAAGWLEVFVKPPDQTALFSVHEDAVDNDDPLIGVSKVVRHVRAPDESESMPGNMTDFAIEGLALTATDCRELRVKRSIRRRLFRYGIMTIASGLESVRPLIPNVVHKNKTLAGDGWRLACYPRYTAIPFLPGVGYAQPIGIDISSHDLLVTMRSVEQFFDAIDTNKYIEEFFTDGCVIPERPSYFSKKLNYLINVNQEIWGTKNVNSSADEFPESRKQASALIEDTKFRSLFGKFKASDIAVDAAIKFITPVFARKDLNAAECEAAPSHITPELLTLMAAAKLFWGAAQVDVSDVETHPRKSDMDSWLRRMGLKDNDASYGTTILRPEAAIFGRPVSKAPDRWVAMFGPHDASYKERQP
ncbi:MAG: hypothetical protein ABI076_01915 [Acidobacteriaceae bacterium]